MFEYKAEITEVVDGDTVSARIDLGFRVFWDTRLRLGGINTPEIRSPNPVERTAAQKAKARLTELILNKTVMVKTFKDKTEKYGRYLAEIIIDGKSVNVQMIAEGLGKSYDGGKRD